MSHTLQEVVMNRMSTDGGAGNATRLCFCRQYTSDRGYLGTLDDKANACKNYSNKYANNKIVRSHSDNDNYNLYSD